MPIGTPIGRSWMRLFGVLPFDYDHLCIAELDRGRGFRRGIHDAVHAPVAAQRTVAPDGDSKTIVRDRITFNCARHCDRLTPVVAAGMGALFGHRQRRLQRYFAKPRAARAN